MSTTKQHPTEDLESVRLASLRKAINTTVVETLDNIEVAIRAPRSSSGDKVTAAVTRLSPLGLEALISTEEETFRLGELVTLDISNEGNISTFCGPIVFLETVGLDQTHIAIRLAERRQPTPRTVERRQVRRWNCPDRFYPTGVASNPGKYNDFVYFRVHDISESGFRILTSMRNRFLAPNMTLDCIISFPMVSQISVTVRIKNLDVFSEDDKEYLAIGVAADRLSKHEKEIISQYLGQFGDVASVSELKESGFGSFAPNQAFQYSFASSALDYSNVLELRHLAYNAEGKLRPEQTVEDMSDVFDARSRILVCRKGDRIVGTARLTFHEHSDTLEHEQYLSWPADLPRRDETVEVTRLCAHPDFQGAGMFFSLLRFCVITAVQARRNWVVSSAASDMVPMYEAVGLKCTRLSFDHPAYNDLKHHVMVGNIQDAMLGRSSNALMWNLVWKDAFAFMSDHQYIDIDAVARVRLALYRAIAPVVPLVRRLISYRRPRS